MASTARTTPDLDGIQAHQVTMARAALKAAEAPDWIDHQAELIGRLTITLEQMLAIISELTGSDW
jgi:hypothetical protein